MSDVSVCSGSTVLMLHSLHSRARAMPGCAQFNSWTLAQLQQPSEEMTPLTPLPHNARRCIHWSHLYRPHLAQAVQKKQALMQVQMWRVHLACQGQASCNRQLHRQLHHRPAARTRRS